MRISSIVSDPLLEVQCELLCFEDHVEGYLNVFSRSIPEYRQKYAQVILEIDNDRYTCYAKRLEGGQRLSLSQNTLDIILPALQEDKTVFIALEGFYGSIHGGGFPDLWKNIPSSS